MTFTSNVGPRRRVRASKHQPWRCDCVVSIARNGETLRKGQPAAARRCYECLAVRP